MRDRYLNIDSLSKFIKNKKGAVLVEFIFAIFILVIMFSFMADLVILRSSMGKLDNVSYSLANVLRERSQLFYQKNQAELDDKVTDREFQNFKILASRMVGSNNVYIVLESLSPNPKDRIGYKIVGDVDNCKPFNSLNNLSHLAPRSELYNERKIPLFQVTLCVPINSMFKAVVLDDAQIENGTLRSSSLTISR